MTKNAAQRRRWPFYEAIFFEKEQGMPPLKRMLQRLGWPVHEMPFRQIARELYRRWFKTPPETPEDEKRIGPASAAGIVFALAGEGDFQSLYWSEETPGCREQLVLPREKNLFLREGPEKALPFPERRKASRLPGKDLVCWSMGENKTGTGWLVDYSAHGIAFITEKDAAPEVGTALFTQIKNRARRVLELGDATVVRIETLTPELSLACLRLDAPCPELNA